jgi:predicted nucleic acid-binding protein
VPAFAGGARERRHRGDHHRGGASGIRPRPSAPAHAGRRRQAAALDPIVTTAADLDAGLSLFERHPETGAFDAVLAAVAIARGAEAVVSADRAFGAIPELVWIDPATPALDRLLGG